MPDSSIPITGRKSAYVSKNRLALIRATQEVLAKQGPSSTVEMVAAHAEIAISTIYKHFPNKDLLFKAAYLAGFAEWEDWAISKVTQTADPYEKLVFPIRLAMKVPQTHPMFAQTIALDSGTFLSLVPQMKLGLDLEAVSLKSKNLIRVEDLNLRVKNLKMILALTLIELCSNPEFTEEEALAGISVALEILGLTTKQIEKLMSAPLPEF